jgi:NAD(P)-dependent dehydrogenase (short-subunit alcohol dehydrogenase family)
VSRVALVTGGAVRLGEAISRALAGAAAIAETVRFLVDGPSAITGEVIRVDGGQSVVW